MGVNSRAMVGICDGRDERVDDGWRREQLRRATAGWSTVMILPDGQVRQEGRQAGQGITLVPPQSCLPCKVTFPLSGWKQMYPGGHSLLPRLDRLLPRPETFLHDWPHRSPISTRTDSGRTSQTHRLY